MCLRRDILMDRILLDHNQSNDRAERINWTLREYLRMDYSNMGIKEGSSRILSMYNNCMHLAI